jgi:anaerobic selenocysteine-containing dehydrogenase
MSVRISQATAAGASLIVVDPRRTALAGKADVWLRVRPGADGALALGAIHVLLEEGLADEDFVRDWTNAPFLVREDTGQPVAGPDLAAAADPRSFMVWDRHGGAPAACRAGSGYDRPAIQPALSGTYRLTGAGGQTLSCRPALELLGELAARYAPERSQALTGVPADQVRRAARLFAAQRPSCYYTWAGLEQRRDAVQTNRAISLFYALTGQFDQRGSNVLFASTPTNPVIGGPLLPAGQAACRLGYAERPLGPAGRPGLVRAADVYRAILTGRPYRVRALIAFGTDLLLAHANPLLGRQALQALDFYVHADLFANPSASLADLLLPAASCWESEAVLPSPPSYALTEHAGTWAQFRPAVVPPVHEARPDLQIIFDLARRLGLGDHFFGGDIESAFDYQLAPSGLSLRQLREHPAGVRAPGQTRYRKYAETDPETGQPHGFATPTGKLEIYSTSFAKAGHAPLPEVWEPAAASARPGTTEDYPLTLTFARLVQYCDDGHRNLPRLRRQAREPFLEIHPATATAAGIQDQEWVLLETPAGAVTVKAKLNASLDPAVVATQYGWWQECLPLPAPGYDPFGPAGANANLLIPDDEIDPISGSVPHRAQRCRVRKRADPAAAAR